MRLTHLDDPETGDFPDERVFASRVDVKYVLRPANGRPDALLVVFSAAHPPEHLPRYTFYELPEDAPPHRLFVLDDHGPLEPLPRPCWYLGRDRRFDVAESVLELMERTAAELGLPRERVITCGASKGAWAAIYFAARFGAGHAIAAEPSTMLGLHLLQEENRGIAAHIAGGSDEEDGEFLDGLLFDALRAADPAPRVQLLSGRTLYYEDHVVPLVEFLRELGVPYELELRDYTEHLVELGRNFPGFLTDRCERLLDGMVSDGRPAARPPGLAARRP